MKNIYQKANNQKLLKAEIMIQFLTIFGILTAVMMGFILSIKFSRYKQRPEQSSCCGAGYCEIGEDGVLHRAHEVPEDHVCCKDN